MPFLFDVFELTVRARDPGSGFTRFPVVEEAADLVSGPGRQKVVAVHVSPVSVAKAAGFVRRPPLYQLTVSLVLTACPEEQNDNDQEEDSPGPADRGGAVTRCKQDLVHFFPPPLPNRRK